MGALSNLGNSLKRRLGLSGPSRGELEARARAAAERERENLRIKEHNARFLAGFSSREGKGIAHQGRLSFGNERLLRKLSSEQRSLRSTGRFDTNRLVL